MRPLSATDCISPAIARTRDLLARPFRLGTFLKIAALAFFADISAGGPNLNLPGHHGAAHALPTGMGPYMPLLIGIFGLLAAILTLVFFYLSSRFQLVLVEMVATRQKIVSPAWSRYGSVTWRWIGTKVVYFLCLFALVATFAAPFIIYFLRRQTGSGFPVVGVALAATVGITLLLALIASYMLLRDFALAPMALEGTGISAALAQVRAIVDREPGQVALYLILKIVLLIASVIAGEILILLAILISLLPLGLLGGVLWFVLHQAGPIGTVLLVAAAVVGALVLLAWMIAVGISVIGPIHVFSQAYALYFLGGRYPLLGNLLDSSTPPPASPQPLFYPGPAMPYPPPPQTL